MDPLSFNKDNSSLQLSTLRNSHIVIIMEEKYHVSSFIKVYQRTTAHL